MISNAYLDRHNGTPSAWMMTPSPGSNAVPGLGHSNRALLGQFSVLPQFPCRSRGALWRDGECGSDIRQDPMTQKVEFGAAVHLPLDQF